MNVRGALFRIQRASQMVRENGVLHVLRRVGGVALGKLGIRSSGEAQWHSRKEEVDRSFDGRFNVDTGGIQLLYDMTVDGPNKLQGVSHIASDPMEFAAAFETLGPDLERFTFVDLGSGKGRALLMAAELPFGRIVGVEFARELHEVAQRNLRSARAADVASGRICAVLGDATAFEFPPGPVVAYLFNPFGEAIVSAVARRLRLKAEAGDEVYVVYVNPVHHRGWEAEGFVPWKQTGAALVMKPALPPHMEEPNSLGTGPSP